MFTLLQQTGNFFLQKMLAIHYENTPDQIYRKLHLQKLKKIEITKNSDIFHISAQNIACGYSLERQGGSNEYPPKSLFLTKNKNYIGMFSWWYKIWRVIYISSAEHDKLQKKKMQPTFNFLGLVLFSLRCLGITCICPGKTRVDTINYHDCVLFYLK